MKRSLFFNHFVYQKKEGSKLSVSDMSMWCREEHVSGNGNGMVHCEPEKLYQYVKQNNEVWKDVERICGGKNNNMQRTE
jgi:hypothetical protein